MKVNNIVNHSMVNGEGIRTVIFFQGCPHHCKGCFSPDSWDITKGTNYTPKELFLKIDEIIKNDKYIDGLTLSGGDPLIQLDLCKFLQVFKSYYPTMNIWLWTGYEFDSIPNKKVLNFIDVIIDGKYKQSRSITKKDWRGSDNQKMYKKVNKEWQMIN